MHVGGDERTRMTNEIRKNAEAAGVMGKHSCICGFVFPSCLFTLILKYQLHHEHICLAFSISKVVGLSKCDITFVSSFPPSCHIKVAFLASSVCRLLCQRINNQPKC